MAGPVPIHNAVSAEDTQFEVCPSRANRRSIVIYNGAAENLYLKYGTGVTTSSFTIRVPPNWYGTMPWGGVYQGAIYGILEAADVGSFVQVTELVN